MGYLAVYRICFALAGFYFLMMLVMLGVKSSQDPRSGIQNGFWGIKFLVVAGIAIGAFFMPPDFAEPWMIIGEWRNARRMNSDKWTDELTDGLMN